MITIPTNNQPISWTHLQTIIDTALILNLSPIYRLIDYYGVTNVYLEGTPK